MRSIRNFIIKQRGVTLLSAPKGTEFMQAMAARDEIVLFAIVDPQATEYETRELHVFFSGFSLPETDTGEEYRYLGTALFHGEAAIHVFERVVVENDGEKQEPQA